MGIATGISAQGEPSLCSSLQIPARLAASLGDFFFVGTWRVYSGLGPEFWAERVCGLMGRV
jgi:hypothetical protein